MILYLFAVVMLLAVLNDLDRCMIPLLWLGGIPNITHSLLSYRCHDTGGLPRHAPLDMIGLLWFNLTICKHSSIKHLQKLLSDILLMPSSVRMMRCGIKLMVCCSEHFPATKSRVPQPWNHPSLSGSIKRMWAHYKLSRLYQRRESFDIPTCFAQWHHASRFKAMHREAQRHGRLVKRERYLNQIQQAEEAAASHNAFVLYRIVHRLAPKQRFQTVQNSL